MKKFYTSILFSALVALNIQATDHIIGTQGLAYSPAVLSAEIGDNVTILASANHPTAEVSEATWSANGTTALMGGFGSHTASFTFSITEAGSIFYVCVNHVGSGMKGRINVLSVGLTEANDALGIEFGANPVKDGLLSYSVVDQTLVGSNIEIFSVSGRKVMEYRISANSGLIQFNQAQGNYIMVLRSTEGGIILSKQIFLED
jgi:plastocyanin